MSHSQFIESSSSDPKRNVLSDDFGSQLRQDFNAWCAKVDVKLKNKSIFTHSDLLHFQRLGFVTHVVVTGHEGIDHTLSMLNLKMERLREIIARHHA